MSGEKILYPVWYKWWSSRKRWVYKYVLRVALLLGIALLYFQFYLISLPLIAIGSLAVFLFGLNDSRYEDGAVPKFLMRRMAADFIENHNSDYIAYVEAMQRTKKGYAHILDPLDYLGLLYKTAARKKTENAHSPDWWLTNYGLEKACIDLSNELDGPKAAMLEKVYKFTVSSYYK
jgi:hypothetical protein